MELASIEDVKRYQNEVETFLKEPWQHMFRDISPKLAIMEFLAYKEGKTIYESQFKKFQQLN